MSLDNREEMRVNREERRVRLQGRGCFVRPSGRRDNHSMVTTSKGLKARRVRLSAHTAIQFYDIQDRLGYDRPSKAIDWLIEKAKASIEAISQTTARHDATAHVTVVSSTEDGAEQQDIEDQKSLNRLLGHNHYQEMGFNSEFHFHNPSFHSLAHQHLPSSSMELNNYPPESFTSNIGNGGDKLIWNSLPIWQQSEILSQIQLFSQRKKVHPGSLSGFRIPAQIDVNKERKLEFHQPSSTSSPSRCQN